MVNGITIEDELKRIEEFFYNLSDEEFDQMVKDCSPETEGNNCLDD